MSAPSVVTYQTTNVWWSDWSWSGWNCVNGGFLLIFVLVGVACCAALAPMDNYAGNYYYYRSTPRDEARGDSLPYRIEPSDRSAQRV